VKKDVLIIGLSSLPGGGKDYIADILTEKYGFYKISPGDIIREKLSKMKKGKISREEQQKLQGILRGKSMEKTM
jgi:Adenylate kinase.